MPLFELESEEPIFAVAFHPSNPEFVYGTGLGHVKCMRYNAEKSTGIVPELVWETKRHRGSCRALVYSSSGEHIYSAGSDGVVKRAKSETGRVETKCQGDSPISRVALTEDYLVVGTDNGSILVYEPKSLKQLYSHAAPLESEAAIASVFSLDHRGRNQFAISANGLVAQLDVTRGVTKKSEEQEDEILDGCYASRKHCAFGMAAGVVTIWNSDHLLDQQHRVKITNAKESVDCVYPGRTEDTIIAGSSDGYVSEIETHSGRILARILHSAEEEPHMLEWDSEYRLVTASFSKIRVWDKDELAEESNKRSAATVGSKRKMKRAKVKAAKASPRTGSGPVFDL